MSPMFVSVSSFIDRVLQGIEEDQSYSGTTPWEQNFPPLDVLINSKTKDVQFKFALSGYKDSEIEVNFEEDALVLSLSQEKTAEEDFWKPIRKGIKKPFSSTMKYPVPFSKYDITKATAKREDGLLIVTIPISERAKPVRLSLS